MRRQTARQTGHAAPGIVEMIFDTGANLLGVAILDGGEQRRVGLGDPVRIIIQAADQADDDAHLGGKIIEQLGQPPIAGDFADQAMETVVLFHLRSEEHTSELQSLMRISYAVFCLKKKKT